MYDLEEIKAIPILEVAWQLGIEMVRGNKAMCFKGHDSRTPSLSFNIRENYFHCFGCDVGGSTIDLVMAYRDCTTSDAIKWLADAFGMADSKTSPARSGKKSWERRQPYSISANRQAKPQSGLAFSEVYESLLSMCHLDSRALNYLKNKRGFSDKAIAQARIGYMKSPETVYDALIKRHGLKGLIDAGLIRESSENPQFLYWDECLIFPFFQNGDIVYLQARRFRGEPKYLNMMGRIAKPAYNLDCLQKLSPNSKVYICEGIPDTLSLLQASQAAVAVLGVYAFKDSYVDLFYPYDVVLCGDGDSAGQEFNKRVGDIFKRHGKAVKALIIPEGKDINEILRG